MGIEDKELETHDVSVMNASRIARRIVAISNKDQSWKINISAGRFGETAEINESIPGPRTIEAVRQTVLKAVDMMLRDPRLLDDPDLCIWLQWNN